jgi:hypothetical protein
MASAFPKKAEAQSKRCICLVSRLSFGHMVLSDQSGIWLFALRSR